MGHTIESNDYFWIETKMGDMASGRKRNWANGRVRNGERWRPLMLRSTGVGFATMVVVFLIDIYYIIIIAWTLFYLIASFTRVPSLPWADCGKPTDGRSLFFSSQCLICISWSSDIEFKEWSNSMPKLRELKLVMRNRIVDLTDEKDFRCLWESCANLAAFKIPWK